MEENLYKHPAYGHVYGKRIKTPIGRIAWPALVTPKENTFPVPDGQTPPPPKYEVTFLIPKKSEQGALWLENIKTMKNQMVKMFNDGRKGAKIAVSDEDIVKDGDNMDAEKYPYYKDHWFIVAKNAKVPDVYNQDVESIEASVPVGGMKAVLIVKPICTSYGLSYQLLTLQLAKDDGVRFGGGQKDSKDLLSELNGGDEEVEIPEDEGNQTTLPLAAAADTALGKKKNSKGGLALDKLA